MIVSFLLILCCAIGPITSQTNSENQNHTEVCNENSVRMFLGPIHDENRWLGVVVAVDWPPLDKIEFSVAFGAPAFIEMWKNAIRVSTSDNRTFKIEASGASVRGNIVSFAIQFDPSGPFPNVEKLLFFDRDVCPHPLQVRICQKWKTQYLTQHV